MNLGIIALICLIAVIAIGFWRKINVGILAIAIAVILGYGSGEYNTAKIVSGYSASLFITLFGLTMLFGIITHNGCLEQVLRRLINFFGRFIWCVPILLFASAWLVSALAGGFAGLAFIVGVTIPVIRSTGYHPIMLMIIGNAGAQAGRYTRLSPDGNIVLNLLAQQGIEGNLTALTLNMTLALGVIALLAYIYFKGYKTKATSEKLHLETQKLTREQWIALASLAVMVFAIMVQGRDAGLVGVAISVALIALGVIDEKTAFNSVPWSTVIMVTGVGVLMKIVINSGGIAILTQLISSMTNAFSAPGASCLMAGVMSWFSSTLGVVVPTLTPTVGEITASIGGNLTAIGLLSTMLIGSSSACFSPASSVGGLILSSIAGDSKLKVNFDNEKAFVVLFVWSVAMVVINSLIALTGFYSFS